MALSNLGLIQMGGAMLRPGGSLGDGFLAYGDGMSRDRRHSLFERQDQRAGDMHGLTMQQHEASLKAKAQSQEYMRQYMEALRRQEQGQNPSATPTPAGPAPQMPSGGGAYGTDLLDRGGPSAGDLLERNPSNSMAPGSMQTLPYHGGPPQAGDLQTMPHHGGPPRAGDLQTLPYNPDPLAGVAAKVAPQQPKRGMSAMERLIGHLGGFPLEQQKQMEESRNWGRDKVARTIEIKGPDNQPYIAQLDDFGQIVGQPIPKPVELRSVSLDGKQINENPYTGQQQGQGRDRVPFEYADASGRMKPGVLNAKRQVAAAGATRIDLGLTKGQESADKQYGQDFVEFTTGGAADAQKNISQLKQARNRLAKNSGITGPVSGSMPDAVNAFMNPEAIAVREQVEEVVQRNLRVVLGAQYTEKEGERLIARAFNPKLKASENIKRLDRLIEQIESATAAKTSAAEYFNRTGTLRGWEGKMPSMSDFDLDGGEEAPKQSGGSGMAAQAAEILRKRREAANGPK